MNIKNNKIVVLCFVVTLLIYGSSGAFTPFLSAYYQANNMSKLGIGLISCVGPIVAITIQPIWGIISDKTGKRKLVLIILNLLSSCSLLLYYLKYSIPLMVLTSFLYTSFSSAIIPLTNAIITRASRRYDFEYVFARIGGPIGFSLFPLLSGYAIEYNPRSMFSIAIVLYLLLSFVLLLMPNDIYDFKDKKEVTNNNRKLFDTNEVNLIFVLCIVNVFSSTILNTYFGTKVIDIGYSENTIGKLNVLLTISDAIALFASSKLIHEYNARTLMLMAVSVSSIRLFLGSNNSLIMLCLCQLLEGFSYMVAFYTAVNYISIHAIPGCESRAQSILVMLESGVGAVLANVMGGLLINKYGLNKSFTIIGLLIMSFVILVCIIYKSKEKKDVSL